MTRLAILLAILCAAPALAQQPTQASAVVPTVVIVRHGPFGRPLWFPRAYYAVPAVPVVPAYVPVAPVAVPAYVPAVPVAPAYVPYAVPVQPK